MKQIAIGLIGLGGMANAHVRNFQKYPEVTFAAVCDVSEKAVKEFGDRLHIPEDKRYADFTALINDADVDVVVSVTPNHVHADVIKACLAAQKPFMAEKPLTRTYEEAVELMELYKANPIPCMIGFSYRYGPAFRYAKQFIQSGKLGTVRHIFVQYMQGWGSVKYNLPMVWRFDKQITGTGTLGDLGSHMIDMARFLIGEFEEVSGQLQTIVKERKDAQTGEMIPVEVDDFASFQARLENDVMAVFQTSRNAFGSGNQHEVSIYGDYGTLHASTTNDREIVWIHEKEENGETVMARETLDVPESLRMDQWKEFIEMLKGSPREGISTFIDGYLNQKVLEAVVQAAETKKTVSVQSLRPAGLL